MWVIVAVTMALTGEPKLTVVPGAEYPSEAECTHATSVRANLDSDRRDIAFSFCVRKDSVQIGPPAADAPAPAPH